MFFKKVDFIKNLVEEYLNKKDWRVNENSNVGYSFSGLNAHISGKIIAEYTLKEIYTKEIANAHKDGYFHIHDLAYGIIPYCAGFSLRDLIMEGLSGVRGKTDNAPPKHLDSLVHQMISFIGTLQNEFAGAQAFNSCDTFLAPYLRKKEDELRNIGVKDVDKELKKYTEQCMQQLIHGLNVNSRWGMQCVPIEYDMLTDKGWRKYDDDYNTIATFNLDNNNIEYLTPITVRSYDYEGEMIRLKNRTQDHVVTPTHKVLRKKFNSNEFELIEANKLINLKTDVLIPNSANSNSIREVDDRWVKLIAWLVSEESKRIPDFIKELSPRQIKLFINTYAKINGYIEPNGRIKLYTSDIIVKDQLQELCVLCGYGTTIRQTENNVYEVNVIRNSITKVKLSVDKYSGRVFCPTTNNGTFICRTPEGKVFITGNSPFSNLSFDLTVPDDLKDQPALIGNEPQDYTYGELQKYLDIINIAFLTVMYNGDNKGRIFTFPIPTYSLTEDFKWDSEVSNLLFKVTAKFGIPYLQNYIGSDINPSSIRAMCCRLQLDKDELRNRPGGMWSIGDNTGSIGVVTLNVNRFALLSKGDIGKFMKLIDKYSDLAKESLEIKRKILNETFNSGLISYTKKFLRKGLVNHFSTIGLVGMNEACVNMLGEDISSEVGLQLAKSVLHNLRNKLKEYQKETGNLYNLEASPSEGASYRLAKEDKKRFKDVFLNQDNNDIPYLTNSTFLPVNKTSDILEALEHQNQLQPLYTGGTIMHVFLGERISTESAKLLCKKISHNTKLPYFSITPTFSVCPKCGYLVGEVPSCHYCKSKTEVYSRVVGFFRPVELWNKGKKNEFKQRVTFKLA